MASNRTVFVTRPDFERLTQLLETHVSRRDKPALTALEEELGRAVVVESSKIPPNVVTMNTRVQFEDLDIGERTEVTLVYPQDGNVDESKISVLAPVGSALLGLSVGQSISWPLPGVKTRNLRVVSVIYQPEAADDREL
jgi:regulator of nucleoside diphosphate kinase